MVGLEQGGEERVSEPIDVEMARLALRIAADVDRLEALTHENPAARVRCTPALVRAAEDLRALVDQAARLGGSAALQDLLKGPR
jgi:hypothetical protein